MQGVGALLLAFLAYRLGLRAYFNQRSAERVRLRLLDGGIAAFAASLDSLLSIQRHNWQMMLRYLKLIRDAEDTVVPEEFLRSLREIQHGTLSVVASHRVTELLGDKLFWIGMQKVYSFVDTRTGFIAGDFGSALRKLIGKPRQSK